MLILFQLKKHCMRRVKDSKGRIKIGNVDRTTEEFKSISSYIPHHCIISNLTVKETLGVSILNFDFFHVLLFLIVYFD